MKKKSIVKNFELYELVKKVFNKKNIIKNEANYQFDKIFAAHLEKEKIKEIILNNNLKLIALDLDKKSKIKLYSKKEINAYFEARKKQIEKYSALNKIGSNLNDPINYIFENILINLKDATSKSNLYKASMLIRNKRSKSPLKGIIMTFVNNRELMKEVEDSNPLFQKRINKAEFIGKLILHLLKQKNLISKQFDDKPSNEFIYKIHTILNRHNIYFSSR